MKKKIPQHVAIVMDGNGRWAEQRGLSRSEGHRQGAEVVKNIVRACIDKQVPILSIWAFGRDNWARPASEVNFLMQLLLSVLDHELDDLHHSGVRLMFTGDKTELSAPLQQAMSTAEAYTAQNGHLILNVLFNYGGKWDILQGVKRIAQDVAQGNIAMQDIDAQLFASYLSTCDLPDPDLFIRTSGEKRISDFFLWQLAYTELYFSERSWPDFTVDEFTAALKCFAERERRYGKTSKQLEEVNHV